MKIHSAVGKRLGITEEEINSYINLCESDFDKKEWLALKYARDLITGDGAEPDAPYMQEFKKYYSRPERAYILKLVRMMRFSNFFNNTFFIRSWRDDIEEDPFSCSIK
jgi:hypothetical protein